MGGGLGQSCVRGAPHRCRGQWCSSLAATRLDEASVEGVTRVSRGPLGSNDFSPPVWLAAQAGRGIVDRQAEMRGAALTQLPVPHTLPGSSFCPLPPEGGTEGGCARKAGQPEYNPTPPRWPRPCGLPSEVCSEPAGPWRRTGKGDREPGPKATHLPGGSEPLYLLRPRLSCSPQARILFWASMCVRLPAFSPSILSTQSPTATPACAALPPGVSCEERRVTRAQRLPTKPRPTVISLPELPASSPRGLFIQHTVGSCRLLEISPP